MADKGQHEVFNFDTPESDFECAIERIEHLPGKMVEFTNSTERFAIEIEVGRLYVTIHTRAIWFCLILGGFLPCIEVKSVRWYFYYKLRLSFGNIAVEWIDNSKSSGRWKKPDSRSWYWGIGEWAAMTDEEYEAWRQEDRQADGSA